MTKPYPGAFTFLDRKKYILWGATVLPVRSEEKPGTILGTGYGFADRNSGICVAAEGGVLWITLLEDEDGNEYSDLKLYELGLKGVFRDE